MRVKHNKYNSIKIKRILLFYSELERYKLTHESSLQLMEYIFAISPRWIEEILRTNDIKDFKNTVLKHEDIDMLIVDAYVKKLNKAVAIQRKTK